MRLGAAQDAEGAKVGLQALPSWLAATIGTAEVRLIMLLLTTGGSSAAVASRETPTLVLLLHFAINLLHVEIGEFSSVPAQHSDATVS